jgi:hypothetical protein
VQRRGRTWRAQGQGRQGLDWRFGVEQLTSGGEEAHLVGGPDGGGGETASPSGESPPWRASCQSRRRLALEVTASAMDPVPVMVARREPEDTELARMKKCIEERIFGSPLSSGPKMQRHLLELFEMNFG